MENLTSAELASSIMLAYKHAKCMQKLKWGKKENSKRKERGLGELEEAGTGRPQRKVCNFYFRKADGGVERWLMNTSEKKIVQFLLLR